MLQTCICPTSISGCYAPNQQQRWPCWHNNQHGCTKGGHICSVSKHTVVRAARFIASLQLLTQLLEACCMGCHHGGHKALELVLTKQLEGSVQTCQVAPLAHVARQLGDRSHGSPCVLTVLPHSAPRTWYGRYRQCAPLLRQSRGNKTVPRHQ